MPQVLVLVGLPGSGKSCFSRQLIRFLPHWQRINQEEVGNREMCETLAAKYLSEGQNVVIDRVNFDEDQRKVWIHIAESHRAAPDALFFDIPLKECKERVKNRKGHASGVEGKGSGTILDRFDKAMVRPTIYEGFRFIHNISHHLPKPKKDDTIDTQYNKDVIFAIMDKFPPPKAPERPPPPPPPAPKPQPAPPPHLHHHVHHVPHDHHHHHTAGHHHHHHHAVEPAKPPPAPAPAPKPPANHPQSDALVWGQGEFTQPFGTMKPPPASGVVAAPIAGYGTYQESRGQWEDESGTQHYNHSLFNENAQKEESATRCGELHNRHVQHTTYLKNEPAGIMRGFEHQSLDTNRDGHELDPVTGSRRDYKERQSYYHQNEREEDAKAGVMRQYENNHLKQYKTLTDHKDPKKERVHAFEHRNFNYSYKGVPFVPEAIMEASMKNRHKFEEEIKQSFQNMPSGDSNFKGNQRVKWDSDFPPKPKTNPPFSD